MAAEPRVLIIMLRSVLAVPASVVGFGDINLQWESGTLGGSPVIGTPLILLETALP